VSASSIGEGFEEADENVGMLLADGHPRRFSGTGKTDNVEEDTNATRTEEDRED
jgi:hypothetical protein